MRSGDALSSILLKSHRLTPIKVSVGKVVGAAPDSLSQVFIPTSPCTEGYTVCPKRPESSKFELCLKVISRRVEHSFVIVTSCYNEDGL